jgi:hypothetical protein
MISMALLISYNKSNHLYFIVIDQTLTAKNANSSRNVILK